MRRGPVGPGPEPSQLGAAPHAYPCAAVPHSLKKAARAQKHQAHHTWLRKRSRRKESLRKARSKAGAGTGGSGPEAARWERPCYHGPAHTKSEKRMTASKSVRFAAVRLEKERVLGEVDGDLLGLDKGRGDEAEIRAPVNDDLAANPLDGGPGPRVVRVLCEEPFASAPAPWVSGRFPKHFRLEVACPAWTVFSFSTSVQKIQAPCSFCPSSRGEFSCTLHAGWEDARRALPGLA
ncbi:hypothetical protein Efla_005184 [Eimeria flavescens]